MGHVDKNMYAISSMAKNTNLRIVALGTYDKGKPRTRIILRGLRENGAEVFECHKDIWGAIEDKSQVRDFYEIFFIIWHFIIAYPVLIWRYLQLPKHDIVLIGYLGLFDVLILWPFVRIRRTMLVWDVFLSLYNTVVEDREMIGKYNPASIVLWCLEWLALRLVDMALIDTQAHANYLIETYNLSTDKVKGLFVGVEPEMFHLAGNESGINIPDNSKKKVLFYGQFIPLHGIETVVRAAKLTEGQDVQWLIIGRGQEAPKIRSLVDELQPKNLEWIEWVNYGDLKKYLAQCHLALGIFGITEKAQRVIPNKVFQILMAGRPLITADTPAIRELLEESNCVKLIPAGSPEALANSVVEYTLEYSNTSGCMFDKIRSLIKPSTIGEELVTMLKTILINKQKI